MVSWALTQGVPVEWCHGRGEMRFRLVVRVRCAEVHTAAGPPLLRRRQTLPGWAPHRGASYQRTEEHGLNKGAYQRRGRALEQAGSTLYGHNAAHMVRATELVGGGVMTINNYRCI